MNLVYLIVPTLKKTETRKKQFVTRQKHLNTHTNVEKDMDSITNVLKKSNQNWFHYNELAIIAIIAITAIIADRYRASSRTTTAIVNAALKDMGILNESNMLDRKKVERERLRVGQKNVNERKCENLKLQ